MGIPMRSWTVLEERETPHVAEHWERRGSLAHVGRNTSCTTFSASSRAALCGHSGETDGTPMTRSSRALMWAERPSKKSLFLCDEVVLPAAGPARVPPIDTRSRRWRLTGMSSNASNTRFPREARPVKHVRAPWVNVKASVFGMVANFPETINETRDTRLRSRGQRRIWVRDCCSCRGRSRDCRR
jgi:hypothetical protein